MPAKPFLTYSLIIYYGYTHAPNLVYKSLDVRYTVFSTIANLVSEMTLGHVVTVALGQVVTRLLSRR